MDRASVISVLEDTKRSCEKCLALLTEDDASYYTFKERSEALDMAIAALREQEQREQMAYEQVQDAVDQHNREAMSKIAAFIEPPKEGAEG